MEAKFEIKTQADLAGLRQTQAELKKLIAELKAAGDQSGRLAEAQERLKRVNRDISTAQGKADFFNRIKNGIGDLVGMVPGLDRVAGSFARLGGGAMGTVATGFLALGAAAIVAKNGLLEYAGAEERVAGLDAALAQRGQLTKEYREKLQDLAGMLQELTSIADDEWVGVLARLTQFGADPDNIEQTADAVKNLAGVLNGDLNSAALMVGKAMQGNFIAFSKLGIEFDENATKAEKLEKLFAELAQRGGGQLEARAQTLGGQWRKLKNDTSDLSEAIGRGISKTGIFQGIMSQASLIASFWAKSLGGPVEMVGKLGNAQQTTKLSIDDTNASLLTQAQRLKAIEDKAKAATDNAKELNSQLDRQKSDADRAASARRDAALKQVDADEDAKRISPLQASQRRVAITQEFAEEQFNREQQTILAKQKLAEEEVGRLLLERAEADKKVQDLESRKAENDKIVAERQPVEQKLAKLEAEVESMRAELAKRSPKGNAANPLNILEAMHYSAGGDQSKKFSSDGSEYLADLKRLGDEIVAKDRVAGQLRVQLGKMPKPVDPSSFNIAGAKEEAKKIAEVNAPLIQQNEQGYREQRSNLSNLQTVYGYENKSRGFEAEIGTRRAVRTMVDDAVDSFASRSGGGVSADQVKGDASLLKQAIASKISTEVQGAYDQLVAEMAKQLQESEARTNRKINAIDRRGTSGGRNP